MLFDGVATFKSLFCFKILKSDDFHRSEPEDVQQLCMMHGHPARLKSIFILFWRKALLILHPVLVLLGKIQILFLRALNLKTFNQTNSDNSKEI